MAGWYPVLLRLDGRKCVVFGGGAVAQRKAGGLLEANADVHIVSPKVTPALLEWSQVGTLRWTAKEAEERDMDGAILVFAATDRPDLNRRLAEAAAERGIPANVADDGESGDFIVPAVLRRGDLILTASASGAGPALPVRIIGELAERYGQNYNENVEDLRTIRRIVKAHVADPSERRALLGAAVTGEALAEWRAASWLDDEDKLIARLRQLAKRTEGTDT
ncbi:bifunctional precorrin-2 dehydrogenase/sirohydrochlorin ferrochelatase [Cohnella sp.]|uniref:precorrin-2 dehydrogenase/sirohydrochlorin ferrochelatase family protein n=1 Tax=Cohnella sp. TaxID=1883426 RepID=UPI00356AEC9B